MTSTPFDTKKIIAETAAKHGLTVEKMLTRKNHQSGRAAAHARAEAAYRIRLERRLSFPQIARVLNYKDHTSVMEAVKKVHLHVKAGNVWPDGYRAKTRPKSIAETKKIKAVPASVVRRFNIETQRAAKINGMWREQGIDAHARVIRDGDYFHVRSSVPLVRVSQ